MEGPKSDEKTTNGERVDHDDDMGSAVVSSEATTELASILKRRRRMSDTSGGGDGGGGGNGEKKDTVPDDVTSGRHDDDDDDDDDKEIGVYEAVLGRLFREIKERDLHENFVRSKNVKRKQAHQQHHQQQQQHASSLHDSSTSYSSSSSSSTTVDVTMQLLEVYNEIVYDLTVPPEIKQDGTYTRKVVEIKQSGRTGRTHVPDAVSVKVSTKEDAFSVLRKGLSHRRSASHAMNVQSSRSHVVVHVKCVIRRSDGTRAFGQLFLVDLAGSEQVKKSEGALNFVVVVVVVVVVVIVVV